MVLIGLGVMLLLAAGVLTIVGLAAQEGVGLIYAAMALGVLAGLVFFADHRRAGTSRPRGPLLPDEGPGSVAEIVRADTAAAAVAAAAIRAEDAAPEPEWSAADQAWDGPEADWDDYDFPIADYDELTESEIMPLLPQLYRDELDMVEDRERAGAARPAVLDELGRLRRDGTDADRDEAAAKTSPGAKAATDAVEWEVDDDAEPPVGLPIEDYDVLSAAEVVSVLGALDDDELEKVREHEAATLNRRTILTNIDRRLSKPARTTPRRTKPLAAPRSPAKEAVASALAPAKGTAERAGAPARENAARTDASAGRQEE